MFFCGKVPSRSEFSSPDFANFVSAGEFFSSKFPFPVKILLPFIFLFPDLATSSSVLVLFSLEIPLLLLHCVQTIFFYSPLYFPSRSSSFFPSSVFSSLGFSSDSSSIFLTILTTFPWNLFFIGVDLNFLL